MIRAMLLTGAALLAGCAGPHAMRTADTNPPAAGTLLQPSGRVQAGQPVARWWQEMNDPVLAGLVDEALAHNLDVAVAVANLSEARALASVSGRDRVPTVTARGGAKSEYKSNYGGNGRPVDRSVTTYDAGFDASWELDLFGRVSQRIAGSQARADARAADLAAIQVSVAAEVARTYATLRGAQLRLDVAERNIGNQGATYKLITVLAEGGRSNDLDVARAAAQLERTRALVPPLQATVTQATNRLGVLTGQAPDALRERLAASAPLPALPAIVTVGDAAGLLQRRPDIQAAEKTVLAATADYNVAVTDLYPRISLTGGAGLLATSGANLLTAGAATGFIAPSLTWAAFDLGRAQDRVDAADARAQAALAGFRQTVLAALEDADSSLNAFSREEERRERLRASATASARAATVARQRYEAGLDSFLDLLDSESGLLEAEDLLATSETECVLRLVALYKALGGGWSDVPAP